MQTFYLQTLEASQILHQSLGTHTYYSMSNRAKEFTILIGDYQTKLFPRDYEISRNPLGLLRWK